MQSELLEYMFMRSLNGATIMCFPQAPNYTTPATFTPHMHTRTHTSAHAHTHLPTSLISTYHHTDTHSVHHRFTHHTCLCACSATALYAHLRPHSTHTHTHTHIHTGYTPFCWLNVPLPTRSAAQTRTGLSRPAGLPGT